MIGLAAVIVAVYVRCCLNYYVIVRAAFYIAVSRKYRQQRTQEPK